MVSQVWFVTESWSGLGRAVVQEALKAGHRVIATARHPDFRLAVVEAHNNDLLTAVLDVTDPVRAESAVQAGLRRFGRIDVVVNNAGCANIAPIEDISLDDFRAQVEAVFFGTVYVTKAALPVFRSQRSGHFIQVTSIGGRLTAPGLSAYQSAKFAVEGFSGVLHQEVAPLGIKVTLAEPGLMRTGWASSSIDDSVIQDAYEPTVGYTARGLRASAGSEPVDPTSVARVLIQVAQLDDLHCTSFSGAQQSPTWRRSWQPRPPRTRDGRTWAARSISMFGPALYRKSMGFLRDQKERLLPPWVEEADRWRWRPRSPFPVGRRPESLTRLETFETYLHFRHPWRWADTKPIEFDSWLLISPWAAAECPRLLSKSQGIAVGGCPGANTAPGVDHELFA
jgi:NAD(P)-dependent dehydrogenase (short-subunit alcohol dehydrogenase family)